LAAVFFERLRDSRRMNQALAGIRPACLGLVFGVAISLRLTNYTTNGRLDFVLLLIGLVDTFCLAKLKWGVPAVIGLSALCGTLFCTVGHA